MSIRGRSDRTIQPGQTEDVEITISSGRRSGKITKRVSGTSNDRENQRFVLTCTAEVKAALKLATSTVNLGMLSHDSDPVEKTLRISEGDAGPIDPKIKTINGNGIEAELREIEAQKEYELWVRAAPPWPNRMLRGSVVLETGVQQSPTENVIVFGRIRPRLSARPSSLRIPQDVANEMNLRTQLIWSSQAPPGEITGVSVSDPELSASVDEDDRGNTFVELHVPAGFEATRGRGFAIVVRTDDPKMPTLRIPVYVQAHRVPATPKGTLRGRQRTRSTDNVSPRATRPE